MEDIKVSGSIVIYKESKKILEKVINSFLSLSYEKELIIVDNSPSDELASVCNNFDSITYIYSNKNLGFGKAHNLAFKCRKKHSDIHLIMNPDIYFDSEDMNNFIKWFFYSDSVLAIPKVFYPNGKEQNIVRKVPTIFSLIKRQFFKGVDEIRIDNEIKEIPFAHGCFFAFKSEIFSKLNGFDERFFMYMEDIDVWIRSKEYGKTTINPNFKIYHYFRRGSKSNIKLFFYHLISAIKFFIKYKSYDK